VRWRYHLGVHKTATTHIQEVLKSQRQALRSHDIRYIPLDELRRATHELLDSHRLPRLRFGLVGRRPAFVTIISEENFLGDAFDACSFPIYPRLERRLEIVARSNSVAFMAIRNPTDFAASVFSEALRHHPDKVSLRSVSRAFLEHGSPWCDLIARVRKFFPDLRVWRYEDYRDHAGFYVSLIAGRPVGVPPIPDPLHTQRLPAETIGLIETLRSEGKELPIAGNVAMPKNPTRFEMFSEAEREWLTDDYEREVEALARVELLVRPPKISARKYR
jgi:hypothetical protein